MVKGVNKTVIEINDTGNIMFEKVILFVSPQYGNISTKRLKSEAENLISTYGTPEAARGGVRQRFRFRKRLITAAAALAASVLSAVALILIF